MTRLPQHLRNVKVRDKDGLEAAEAIWQAVREEEERLGEEGRVLVRTSGTEQLVRVMCRGAEPEAVRRRLRPHRRRGRGATRVE